MVLQNNGIKFHKIKKINEIGNTEGVVNFIYQSRNSDIFREIQDFLIDSTNLGGFLFKRNEIEWRTRDLENKKYFKGKL